MVSPVLQRWIRTHRVALVLTKDKIKDIDDMRKWFERFEKVLNHKHFRVYSLGLEPCPRVNLRTVHQ